MSPPVTVVVRRRIPWPGTVLAALIVVFFALAAVWPELLAHRSPIETDFPAALLPPSSAHLFGTDQLGRDLWSRVVHGTRISLMIGLSATVLAAAGGLILGLLAAFGGRIADMIVMRVVDVLLSLPSFLLALLVVAVLGPGPVSAIPAITLASIPRYARLVRGQAIVVRRSEYVEAAISLGRSKMAIVLRHVLPNTLGPLVVVATVGIGSAITIGATLSFLGLGPQQPTPEWGAILANGRNFGLRAWWLMVFPGLAVTLTVIAFTVLGKHAQARAEGRLL
jgi:peptide/nickel transport system permease protein